MAHCNYNGPIGSAAPSGTCEALCSALRCPRCGQDSGAADKDKFREWYIAHRALTCRGRRPNNGVTGVTTAGRNVP